MILQKPFLERKLRDKNMHVKIVYSISGFVYHPRSKQVLYFLESVIYDTFFFCQCFCTDNVSNFGYQQLEHFVWILLTLVE